MTGNSDSGPLQDIIFAGSPPPAPFPDVFTFHDLFSGSSAKRKPDQPIDIHPMRRGLPDDPIKFTYGDLHRSNILARAAGKGPVRIMAVLDWHQAGWYPAYWEYCKAHWTAEIGDEWVDTYLPKIMRPRPEVYDYWNYFVLSRGR